MRFKRLATRPAGLLALSILLSSALALMAHATAPEGRYKVAATEVTDRRTGLIWQRATNAPLDFASARSCPGLESVAGSSWRLPTAAELVTLVDVTQVEPAIDTDAFPDTELEPYWTSTAYADPAEPNNYWAVDFEDGTAGPHSAGQQMPYRCVRTAAVLP